MPDISNSQEKHDQKIKRLERELEDEKVKNHVLNRMVDIMDKEHGSGLRKKFSSAVSGKPKASAHLSCI